MKWLVLFLYSLCFLAIWGFLLLDRSTISFTSIFIGLVYTSVSYDIVRTELLSKMPRSARYVVLIFPVVYVVSGIVLQPFNLSPPISFFLRLLDPITWAFLLLLASMYWLHGYFRFGMDALKKWFILLFFCYFYSTAMHYYWDAYSVDQAIRARQATYVPTLEEVDLEITASDGSPVDIGQILDRASDSLVYMDFWASWCAPCVAEFPYSDSIQLVLKDEPVKFMYLSIDESQLNWMKGQKRHHLMDKDSYWIQNVATSEFIRSHKINSIPRYILIGRNREIIDADAPRPSEEELMEMIRAHLVK